MRLAYILLPLPAIGFTFSPSPSSNSTLISSSIPPHRNSSYSSSGTGIPSLSRLPPPFSKETRSTFPHVPHSTGPSNSLPPAASPTPPLDPSVNPPPVSDASSTTLSSSTVSSDPADSGLPPPKPSVTRPIESSSGTEEITPAPALVSAEKTSTISGVTGNTLYPTVKDGKPTEVPVLSGPKCSIFCDHGVLILWGIGPGNGKYVLPPMPKVTPLPSAVAINNGVPTPIGTQSPEEPTPSTPETEETSSSDSTSTESTATSTTATSSASSSSEKVTAAISVDVYTIGAPVSTSSRASSSPSKSRTPSSRADESTSATTSSPSASSRSTAISSSGHVTAAISVDVYTIGGPASASSRASSSASKRRTPSSSVGRPTTTSSPRARSSSSRAISSSGHVTAAISVDVYTIGGSAINSTRPSSSGPGRVTASSRAHSSAFPRTSSAQSSSSRPKSSHPTGSGPKSSSSPKKPSSSAPKRPSSPTSAKPPPATSPPEEPKKTETPPPPPPPPPKPTADCKFWHKAWGWEFEIYNIKGWADDGGKKLRKEEEGCGGLTDWDWEEGDDKDKENSGSKADFYLPYFIRSGCVERAVDSAGGPKISCDDQGVDLFSANAMGSDELEHMEPEQSESDQGDSHVYVPMDWSQETSPAR